MLISIPLFYWNFFCSWLKEFLHILNPSFLLDNVLTMFSQSVDYLFIFSIVFQRAENFNFINSINIFLFYSCFLWSFSKNFPNTKGTKIFFSSRRFIVLAFMFQSIIHFEWTFLLMLWGRGWGSFIPHIDIQLFQYHFLKKNLSFLIGLSWYHCENQLNILYVGLFLDSTLFHFSMCLTLYKYSIYFTALIL